jgi:protoporphyrinogen/coproporphyrinogen III oxidase
MQRVVVVGGGIAGLATAHVLLARRPGLDLVLLEADDRLGGNIRTSIEEGFTLEWGVNGFLNNVPETLELIEDLGMTPDLLPSNQSAARRFLYRGGQNWEIPLKPPAFFRSGLLSRRGRLRILGEPFARPRPAGDETVFAFAARRIGPEAARVLVDAMVSGVYAGDSRVLSLRSTFPRMEEMERVHGSLVKALIARQREARRAGTVPAGGPAGPAGALTSFRRGMESLVERLGERIGRERVRLGTPVLEVLHEDRTSAGKIGAGAPYVVRTATGEFPCDHLVVAAPARHASRFLLSLDAPLARELDGIAYAGLAVVALAWDQTDLDAAPEGFGFLVPRGEGLRILGCLWDSSVFPCRAPEGRVLVRAMIGGAQDPEAVSLPDEELLAITRRDLEASMGIRATPNLVRIYRHPLGIPQYLVGHADRLTRIDRMLQDLPGVALAGNSYRGVAVNSCAKEAKELGVRWAP